MAESNVMDMGLAEFGRKERTLAEHDMSGLMNCRKEYGPSQPFKGLNMLAAHDNSDGRVDRDACCHGRQGPLVLSQYLLHSGPRSRKNCQGGHLDGLGMEGRDALLVLVVH